MPKPIQDSLLLVKQTQMELNKNLAEPQYNTNLLELNSLFQRIISRLVFMGGILEPENAEKKTKLGPITRFMGKEIKQDKVTAADLDPNEAVKKQYLQKVDKLYEQISFIQPSIILNSYTIDEDILVLRGVAKRAGIENYKDRELNIQFVEEIVAAIKAKKDEAALQKTIDDNNKNKGTEVTVTQGMIDGSEFLQKKNVKPGDKVTQLPDGKFKIPAAKPATV